MPLFPVLPLVPLVLILATDLWVYLDDKALSGRGEPVVFEYGGFRLDAPFDWVVACTVFWVIFFPLYLIGRRG